MPTSPLARSSHPRALRAGAVALLGLGLALTASAQLTPLVQWNFTGASGAPAVTPGGGTLAITGTGGSFATTGGVSGQLTDGVLNLSTNTYGAGTAARAATATANVLSGLGTQSQVTLTLWVKGGTTTLGAQAFPRIFMAGATSTYDNAANGLALLFSNGAVQIGVNGRTVTSGSLTAITSATDWVFMAVSYDGTSNPYFSSAVQSAGYGGGNNNTSLLLGSKTTTATLAYNAGLTLSDFQTTAGTIDFDGTGASTYAFLGNRSDSTRGLNGYIDDVRLYSGVLSATQINDIRTSALAVSAVPEPGTYAVIFGCLALLGAVVRRRRPGA